MDHTVLRSMYQVLSAIGLAVFSDFEPGGPGQIEKWLEDGLKPLCQALEWRPWQEPVWKGCGYARHAAF